MHFTITELERKLANLIRIGAIEEADYTKSLYRVRTGDILTNWLPCTAGSAGKNIAWKPLDIGEQVIIFSPFGDMSQGVIQGSLYQNLFPAPSDDPDIHKIKYEDGTEIEYNRESHHLKIKMTQGTADIDIPDITITGDLTLKGKFTHDGDLEHEGDTTHNGDLARIGSEDVTGDRVQVGEVTANGKALSTHHHIDSLGSETSQPI